MVQLDLRLDDLKVGDDKKANIESAMARLDKMNVDLWDNEYFSQEKQAERMDAALTQITKDMDDRLAKIMGRFDDKLDELKSLGAEFPSFEEWEEDFDEEEWRKTHPQEAAEIDDMFGNVPQDGYLGDIEKELMD